MQKAKSKFQSYLFKPISLAPLSVFRMMFGGMMFLGVIRFALMGWIHDLYVEPAFLFPYFGFEWLPRPSEFWIYGLFVLMAFSFLFMAIGLFYRLAAPLAFFSFTYVELLDKSNYLNHYYFVSLVCFLLIFVPAHRYFSLDILRKPSLFSRKAPQWTLLVFQWQLLLVYFFAGLAKLNADWLMEALPLRIWLPAKSDLPFVGPWLQELWVAYAFSWFGAAYDLLIPFLLWKENTRKMAFAWVVLFHLTTWVLFPIGMFPFIMITATLIFFSADFHESILKKIRKVGRFTSAGFSSAGISSASKTHQKILVFSLAFFFGAQVLLPLRYLAYPGDLFWTEQGYRFSWRVMLMEKAGHVTFRMEEPETGRKWEVKNYEHLSPNQEKMMSTQADMILQFAQYLDRYYSKKGFPNLIIRADAFVSLNGRLSQRFINPEVDLSNQTEGFNHKSWILPAPKSHSK